MIIRRIYYKIRNNIIADRFEKCGRNFVIGKYCSIVNPQYIQIGDRFSAEKFCYLQAWDSNSNITGAPQISIGNDVSFMGNVQLSCARKIVVGDGVLVGDNVLISDNYHGKGNYEEIEKMPLERCIYSKGDVSIGDNTWIGRNVCIMPNVHIGKSVIVGANSVVTKDVEDYAVVAGVPAKVIRINRELAE